MGQIISSFSVVIISDPCHPWEPDWYSISCVSCWFTELCSCYLPYWSSVAERKIQVRMYFSVGREALQWLSRLARGFLRPVTSLLAVQAMELVCEIPPAVDYNETRPRSICDGNFLSNIVTNFLFRTSCGQRRSIVKELMFLFNLFFWWKYVFFFE